MERDHMARNVTTYLEPGSYSHGTLRDEDLADMFDTIAGLVNCDECRDLVAELQDYLRENAAGMFVGPEVGDVMHDLFDHVDQIHTPSDDYYFGAIEGDASDFGVWRVWSEGV